MVFNTYHSNLIEIYPMDTEEFSEEVDDKKSGELTTGLQFHIS